VLESSRRLADNFGFQLVTLPVDGEGFVNKDAYREALKKAPVLVSIDAATQRVVLAENDALLSSELLADDWVWAGGAVPTAAFEADVKIRLGSKGARARLSPAGGGKWRVEFSAPQRALTPGQSAVAYIGGIIAGGGIIV
jgi:tRNA-specific 2-thiouridylase